MNNLIAAITTKQETAYSTDLPHVNAGGAQLQQILQVVLGVLAATAVLVIVIAGLRFVTSQGNPQETSKARSTILYAIAGLVIVIFAESVVTLTLRGLNP